MQYDPTFDGRYSKYQGYQKIAMQVVDPVIVQSPSKEMDVSNNLTTHIFASSLRRGVLTANRYYDSQDITLLDELKEVKVDLTALLSEEEYVERGSDLVRERFIEAFIKDTLNEKRSEIESRLKSLLKIIEGVEEGDYLMISHSFFMKILQAYVINRKIFKEPSLLKYLFDPKVRTFDFGCGFDVCISEKEEFVVK